MQRHSQINRFKSHIDLFVPEQYFRDVVSAGAEYVSKPAQHYCEEAEGWDLEYVQFIFEGTKVEIGNSQNAKIFDSRQSRWNRLEIDFKNTVKGVFLGSEISVMPKADLIHYKSLLDRPVDMLDIASIKA